MKTLMRAGLFIATFVALLAALDHSADLAFGTHIDRKYRAMFAGLPLPWIVMGTSTAAHGIHPGYLTHGNEAYYNFAINGGNPTFYRQWYTLFKQYAGRPSRVILAVDWFLFYRIESMSRDIRQDAWCLPWKPYLGLSQRPGDLLMNMFFLVGERSRLQRTFFGDEVITYDMSRYDRGWVPQRYLHPDVKRTPQDGFLRGSSAEPARADDFKALLTELKGDGARILLVAPPQYLPSAGEHRTAIAAIAAIARAHQIPFLDYNAEKRCALNADPTLFNDWAHLNEPGSKLFSQRLAKDLQARDLL